MTEHFSQTELQCPCGCKQSPMSAGFMAALEELRTAYDQPMTVSSAYRCPHYNARISHTGRTGPHTTGHAVDIVVSGADAYNLLLLALQFGFSGVGISQRGHYRSRFIHLDDLSFPDFPRPRVWSY